MESKKNRQAFLSGIWYTVSNFFMKAMVFLVTPVFTRMLTREEFGLYHNFQSWLMIFTILITLNLEATLIRARFEYADTLDMYIASVLVLSTVSCMVWLLLFLAFHQQFYAWTGLGRFYLVCMCIYFMFLPALNLFLEQKRYFFQYRTAVATGFLVAAAGAGLSVCFVSLLPDRLTGRILGQLLPTVAVGSILYIYIIGKGKKICFSYWIYALKICVPYIPHLLSLSLLNSVDKLMIRRICGASDTALYSLAYTCGAVMTLLMTSLNGAFVPWLGERLAGRQFAEIRKVSAGYILVFSAAAAGMMLVAPEILYVLGGKSYMEARYVMPPVVMGCVAQFIYTLFVNVEQFQKKTVGMAFASISAAVFNYVLNLYFIPRYGYLAAAYTTLTGYLWLMLIHMMIVKKTGYGRVYDECFLFQVTVVLLCFMAAQNVLYDFFVIRYLCLAVYILFCIRVFFKKKGDICR